MGDNSSYSKEYKYGYSDLTHSMGGSQYSELFTFSPFIFSYFQYYLSSLFLQAKTTGYL